MAILTKPSLKSAHWYTRDGKAMHEVPKAKQKGTDIEIRPTTLTDARKLNLFPSVTGIIDIFAKPQLENWKMGKVAIAALKVQKQQEESDNYWTKRVVDAAFQEVEEAADLGTSIHKAMEMALEDGDMSRTDPALTAYVAPALQWFADRNLIILAREKVIVNVKDGFAGTMDLTGQFMLQGKEYAFVLDYKTRKTKPGVKVLPYNFQSWQIAAYGATYHESMFHQHRVYGINLYISSTEPGRIEHVRYEPKELAADYAAFRGACMIWRRLKGYDPRVVIPVQQELIPTAPAPLIAPEPAKTKGNATDAQGNTPGDRIAKAFAGIRQNVFQHGETGETHAGSSPVEQSAINWKDEQAKAAKANAIAAQDSSQAVKAHKDVVKKRKEANTTPELDMLKAKPPIKKRKAKK